MRAGDESCLERRGARNTPRASAARCQRANNAVSAALASAKFLTGPGVKYIPHIEPACPVVTGTRAGARRPLYPRPAARFAAPVFRKTPVARSLAQRGETGGHRHRIPRKCSRLIDRALGRTSRIRSARPPYAPTGMPPPTIFAKGGEIGPHAQPLLCPAGRDPDPVMTSSKHEQRAVAIGTNARSVS